VGSVGEQKSRDKVDLCIQLTEDRTAILCRGLETRHNHERIPSTRRKPIHILVGAEIHFASLDMKQTDF
jgi:hypothetical protein